MAKRHKEFALYPGWILDVITRLSGGEAIVQMQVADRASAYSTCHMFVRGKNQYCREMMHVAGTQIKIELALDIVARPTNLNKAGIEGRYIVEFVLRGQAVFADHTRGLPSKFEQNDRLPSFEEERVLPQETLDRFVQNATPRYVEEKNANDPFERMMEGMLEKHEQSPVLAREKEPMGSSDELSMRFVKEAEVRHECPPHEWNSVGSSCVHCSAPRTE